MQQELIKPTTVYLVQQAKVHTTEIKPTGVFN